MVSKEFLRTLFKYDYDGADKARPLVRIKETSHRSKVGHRPGYVDDRGYVKCCVAGRQEYMHRIVYCYFYGDNFETIDHINRDKSDNRIDNLRSASQMENSFNLPVRKNNISGVSGVNWNTRDQVWHVRIRHSGKRHWVGIFKHKSEAIAARIEAVNKYHGEFKGE